MSYRYVSPSGPNNQTNRQPEIGFKTTISNNIPNMSGYPQYPSPGGPYNPSGYGNYPQAAPGTAPSYPPAGYPSHSSGGNPAYPGYPSSVGQSYPSNPYQQSNPGYPSPASSYASQTSSYPASMYQQQSTYPPTNPSYGAPMPNALYPTATYAPGPHMYPGVGQQQQPMGQNYSYPVPAPAPSYYPQQQPTTTASYGPYTTQGPTYSTTYGTIVPHQPFDPKNDAEMLRKAMKGIGTDEATIIRILCNRTAAQRAQIALDYKTLFGKDLVSNLKSELTGNFEDVICALMVPRATYLARNLHRAMCGIGTAELTLIEILCTSTNAEIRELNNVYKQEFRKPLESDLRGDTSGYFKRLLVSLNVGNRDENPTINHAKAIGDAQRLYQAGEARWGTDESVFNSILVSQSFAQLRVVFQEYERLSNRTIEFTLNREMSGDLLQGMLAIVKCVRNRCSFFAERLRNSLKGAGTEDSTLIRIIVSRSEIDLKNIKDDYQRMFGRTLAQDISDDTSGDYKRVLLEIIKYT
ncbi:hypothetical protein CHUAL_014236 [Chamberlinius hualienensis]